ncbi:MAG: hypothetical protein LWY06_05165 [Firmicutes bacterium]|nr:hypothetical protein [Bacillota bacterium]
MRCQKPEYSDKLIPYIEKSLPSDEMQAISDHVCDCQKCQDEVRNLTEVMNALGVGSKKIRQAWVHPEPEELLSWLNANPQMTTKESSEIASHIARCSLCQEEIQLLAEAPEITEEESTESVIMPAFLKQTWQNSYGRKQERKAQPSGFAAFLEFLQNFLFASRRFSYVAIIFMMVIVTGFLMVNGPSDKPHGGGRDLVAVNSIDNGSPAPPEEFTPVLKGDGKLPGSPSEFPLTGMTGVNGAMAPDSVGTIYASDVNTSKRLETAFMRVDSEAPGGPEWSSPDDSAGHVGQPANLQDPENIMEPPISEEDLKVREQKTWEIQKRYTGQIAGILKEEKGSEGFRVQVFATLSPFRDTNSDYSIKSLTVYIEYPGVLKSAEKSNIENKIRSRMGFKGDEIFIFDPMY